MSDLKNSVSLYTKSWLELGKEETHKMFKINKYSLDFYIVERTVCASDQKKDWFLSQLFFISDQRSGIGLVRKLIWQKSSIIKSMKN